MGTRAASLRDTLPSMAPGSDIRLCLQNLRRDIDSQKLREYVATGVTPQRTQYLYPSVLPRTQRENVAERFHNSTSKLASPSEFSPSKTPLPRSPTKNAIYADSDSSADDAHSPAINNNRPPSSREPAGTPSLRELDPNVVSSANNSVETAASAPPSLSVSVSIPGNENAAPPPLKRQNTGGSKVPTAMRKGTRKTVGPLNERENVQAPVNFSASVGPGAGGRKLRSHGSS